MKQKIESGKKILRCWKSNKFRKQILKNLKTLVSRVRLWKKFELKERLKIEKVAFNKLKETVEIKKQQEQK